MKTLNIKVLILMIFLSGILQMDILNISWETLKIISIIHIFASIFLCIFYIIPFVNRHAYKYIVIKKVNSIIGWVLGFVLFFIVLSGFYLFFIGNTGGDILGIISSNIHLYGSFVLLFFLFYHTKNPVKKTFASLFLVSYSLIPTLSYSFEHQLSNIKTHSKQ
jgi:hypothetical protein